MYLHTNVPGEILHTSIDSKPPRKLKLIKNTKTLNQPSQEYNPDLSDVSPFREKRSKHSRNHSRLEDEFKVRVRMPYSPNGPNMGTTLLDQEIQYA